MIIKGCNFRFIQLYAKHTDAKITVLVMLKITNLYVNVYRDILVTSVAQVRIYQLSIFVVFEIIDNHLLGNNNLI